VSNSLPGLARFGCDLSATVGGIPNFGQTSPNRGSGHCDTDEKRGPGSMGGSSSLLSGKGRNWHRAQQGRHSSINPAAWAGTWPRLPIGHWPAHGTRRAAIQVPLGGHYQRVGMERNFEYVLVWRFRNSRARHYRICGTDPISCDSARIYFLGGLGRRRCRKRTPGPPPFSSMNSTPAASKARRTAKSLATVREVLSSASSARLIVLSPSDDARARSFALHLRRARAARI
jgi:hypothetical protein